jgi:hypothetical protein
MANEAVIIELLGSPKGGCIRFACSNGASIEKGTLLKMSGSRMVAATTAAGTTEKFAGIAAEEKVAGDGATSIGVWTCGVFDLFCPEAAMGNGQLVSLSGANMVKTSVAADILSGLIVGRLLEDVTAASVNAIAIGVY